MYSLLQSLQTDDSLSLCVLSLEKFDSWYVILHLVHCFNLDHVPYKILYYKNYKRRCVILVYRVGKF